MKSKERKAGAEERQPRRRAGEALRYSNAVLNASLESTADGILVVDNAGRIIFFNGKFLELWQIPAGIASSGEDHGFSQEALSRGDIDSKGAEGIGRVAPVMAWRTEKKKS